ncbi:hypothetical protein [Sporosarcina ureilytica]|nr:hypothetical protein [Sporosarcina ureilytica]
MFNKMLRMILLCFLFILLISFMVPWLRFAAFIIGSDGSFAKQDIMISPLYLGYLITLVSATITYLLSMGKSKKRKYTIWGIAVMLPISLPLAYSIGITYSFIVEDPWATILLLYVFPVIFIVGLILLLVGIFKKNEVLQY